MKVLIQTAGSAGDTHPFIGVGRVLRERGHEVVLFGNAVFSEVVERAGLRFVQTGDREVYRGAIENPDLCDARKGLRVAVRPAMDVLSETIASIEEHVEGASVVIGSTLGFAARIVRELHDIPLVLAHLAPVSFRSVHRMPKSEVMWVGDRSPMWMKRWWWSLVDLIADSAVGAELNAVRAEFGLDPVKHVFEEWLVYSPERTLGLFPDWFAPRQPDWPPSLHLTGFTLFDEADQRPVDTNLESWLGAGDPPVVFTPGSANVQAAGFFRAASNVCRELGLRAVFATSNPDDVPRDAPSSVRVEGYVPFSWLLPRSRALVSHGGVGTCAQALAAGVPHLVTHINFDQRDNGSRLKDLGAGDLIPMRKFGG